jgi:hypothetical protein
MSDYLLNGYEVVTEDDFNRLVNEKAGEVLERERQRQEQQRMSYEKNKQIIENTLHAKNDQRRFFKVYENKGETMRELSLINAGILFKLTTNLYYGGEGLLTSGKTKEGGLKPLNKKELAKLLGRKSKKGIYPAIESLQAIGALRVEKQGRSNAYYINEDLVSCGKGTGSGSFTKVYKTKAQELLDKMTDSEAGFIFKCLPYIHYSTHALVLNPHEEDLKKVNAVRGAELGELLGLDAGTMNNISTSLKRKQLMMFINIGTKGKGYVINPYLADRGFRSEYTERTRAYFDVFEEKKSSSEEEEQETPQPDVEEYMRRWNIRPSSN